MSVNEVKLKKAATPLEVRGTGHDGSRTFVIGDEDHTLGNTIRHILMQNGKVSFAGYSVPHPMDPYINIRVQTVAPSQNKSGEEEEEKQQQIKAIDALSDACLTLSAQCDFILGKVEEILPEVRDDRFVMEKVAAELSTLKMDEDNTDDDEDEDEGMELVDE